MKRFAMRGARVGLATGLLLAASYASAATFIVTSTADTAGSTCGSTCTLRQAITAANATTAADTINFAILSPAKGELLIQPASGLPTITQPLTIDGYSQSGSAVNTDSNVSNARLRIRIDGANAGASINGLAVCASNVTLRGLSVTGFSRTGISFGFSNGAGICASPSSGGKALGNFIGLSSGGTAAVGNGTGIEVALAAVVVGGTALADRNVISGNQSTGLSIYNALSSASVVVGNLIGTDKTGTVARGNGSRGVQIGPNAAGLVIGNTTRPNLIAYNGGNGVSLASNAGSGSSLFANRIHSNTNLGIDLGDNGATGNDTDDGDPGPNGLQNHPELSAASRIAGGLSLTGTLEVGNASAQNYQIAIYANATCDSPGTRGEGERFLGFSSRSISNGAGQAFSFNLNTTDPLPPGTVLTTTATAPDGSTSEFSECFFLDPLPIVVNSAADPGNGICDASECTLREAISTLNTRAEDSQSVIEFNIPGSGERRISVASALPTISRSVLIDGYTQSDARPNADPVAHDAVVRVRLDGASAGAGARGLAICADNVTVRGLSITRFVSSAIAFGLSSTGSICASAQTTSQVAGNFLGIAVDGITAAGNGVGVLVQSGRPTIGGTALADRNLISGNSIGVALDGASITGTQLLGNLIGTNKSAIAPTANGFGILFGGIPTLGSAGVVIGTLDAPNLIAFNTKGLVASALTGTRNTWFANAFHSNAQLGIDLGDNGVTTNDTNDTDSGPNGLQNFPVLSLAQRSDNGLVLRGDLLAQPSDIADRDYTIAIYASTNCDANGHGEGERFLGTGIASLGFSLGTDFQFAISTDDPLPPGTQITATATDRNGNSSEFSPCLVATDPPPGFEVNTDNDSDDGTCNGAHCSLREAINAANALPGADIIRFGLTGDGPHTIVVPAAAKLPTITDSVIVDGYTQLGASPNTNQNGSNAVLQIVLNVINGSGSSGLTICADDVTIRGLALIGGSGPPLIVGQSANGTCPQPPVGIRIAGNFVGLLPDGVTAAPTNGILLEDAIAEVGGNSLADRNLLAGTSASLSIQGAMSAGTVVRGNYFGTDASGSADRGMGNTSINLSNGATGVVVGDPVAPNVLRFSPTGITVNDGSSGNRLFANEFASHDQQPIALCSPDACSSAPMANDPDDTDTGGNHLQNFPVLLGGEAFADSFVINGLLDVPSATANAPYTIALYENATCGNEGHGEGEIFLGAQIVNLSGTSIATESFSLTVPVPPPAPGRVITATATDPQGNTSGLSACLAAPVVLTIFADSFE